MVVDDDPGLLRLLTIRLRAENYEVEAVESAALALAALSRVRPDLVITDLRMDQMDGIGLLKEIQSRAPGLRVIILTAHGTIPDAVQATQSGAFAFLTKPVDKQELLDHVQKALKVSGFADTTEDWRREIVTRSTLMEERLAQAHMVAGTDARVMITGESGTGKELVARAIHRHSHRSNGPFLPICLAALSPGLVEGELFGHVRGSFTGAVQDRKGLLELAAGGTVLLDEIGDVPLPLQVKLLRTIEHREVTPVGDARPRPTNIRILAATNRPLQAMIAAGEFREDLYFRLSVFPIHVPPLRERREDIPLLAEHFLRLAQVNGIERAELTPAALRELQRREWTGNVRELRNVIEHAAIVSRGHAIGPEHLLPPLEAPAGERSSSGQSSDDVQEALSAWARTQALHVDDDTQIGTLYERYLELVEPPLLKTLLERTQGNRAAAAQFLGIHRATLRQKLKRYGIE